MLLCGRNFLSLELLTSISETLLLISGDKWMYCGWGNNMILPSYFVFFKPLKIEALDKYFLKSVLMFYADLSVIEENRKLSLSTEKESAL